MTLLTEEQRYSRVRRLESGTSLALLAGIVLLHGRMLWHGGALWRDEVNTVNVAGKSALTEFWSALEFDAQPALWPLLLRGWLATGWGAQDFSLRVLGCATSLCVLVALRWNARLFSPPAAWPGLSWLLLGASPVLFKWGGSLRAYGLGTVLALLTFGTVWKLVERPSRRTLAAAALCAMLSVHTLYVNAVMLLALCASGAIVGWRKRDWKGPALLLGLGLCCALSMAPYYSHIAAARDWGKLIRTSVSMAWLVQQFYGALGASGGFMPFVWIALWLGAVTGCVWLARHRAGADQDRAVFLGGVLYLGPLSCLGFLLVLGYAPPPWYYLLLMGFLAVAIDATWEAIVGNNVTDRVARLAGCVLLSALIALPSWRAAGQRHTTVDLAAKLLEQRAVEKDLILVTNWAPGITFMRYFHGNTAWITLPNLSDHSVHRFDLVAQRMAEDDPLVDVMQRLADTLQSGQRVWILGELLPPRHLAAPLPPAPGASTGWQEFAYSRQWKEQVTALLRSHGAKIEIVLAPLPPAQADDYENLPLSVAEGWH